jgi:hypothetical protein
MQDLFPPVIGGTLREHYILLFGAAGAFALLTGLFGAWIGAYFGGRRGARREIARAAAGSSTAVVEAQLVELRHAVETMALEMERISEGQRFTARMLVERVPPAQVPIHPRREAGSITPH